MAPGYSYAHDKGRDSSGARLLLQLLCTVAAATAIVPDSAQARGRGIVPCAADFGNGKAFFFRGTEYIRYDIPSDRADPGFPKPIAGNWPGLWDRDIDSAFNAGNGKVFFFKGSEYVRYDIRTDRADPGFPKPIRGNWPGVWDRDIDAAYGAGNGKAYLFKGQEYVRYDIRTDRADPGFPKPIAGNWPGMWDRDIESGYGAGNGKAYLFKGQEYVRYDIATDRTDAGYPKPIAGYWPGVWTTPLDAPPLPPLSRPPVAGSCPKGLALTRNNNACTPLPQTLGLASPGELRAALIVPGIDSRLGASLAQYSAAIMLPTRDLTKEQALLILQWLHAAGFIRLAGIGGSPAPTTFGVKLASRVKFDEIAPKLPEIGKTGPETTEAVLGWVAFVYNPNSQKSWNRSALKSATNAADNLDPRNAVGLYRLANFLYQNYQVTDIHHSGINGSDFSQNECHKQGRAIDFVGVTMKRGQPPLEYFVSQDWGKIPVPEGRREGGIWPAHFWRFAESEKPSYRLANQSMNLDTPARFFYDVYWFMALQYAHSGPLFLPSDIASKSGIGGWILHPDYEKSNAPKHPDTKEKWPSNGREAHIAHFHFQIGTT